MYNHLEVKSSKKLVQSKADKIVPLLGGDANCALQKNQTKQNRKIRHQIFLQRRNRFKFILWVHPYAVLQERLLANVAYTWFSLTVILTLKGRNRTQDPAQGGWLKGGGEEKTHLAFCDQIFSVMKDLKKKKNWKWKWKCTSVLLLQKGSGQEFQGCAIFRSLNQR